MTFQKGYVQSAEHKASISAAQKARWAKIREGRPPKAPELKETACSVCNEFAVPEEYLELGRRCKGTLASRNCVFEGLLTRILKDFKRIKK